MQRGRLLTGIRLWGGRRIQAATIIGALGGTVLLAVLFTWYWSVGAVTIGAAVLVYRESRLLHPSPPPWRPPGAGWFFGGELFAYAELGRVGHPRQVIDQLAAAYQKGQAVELLVWIAAKDQAGHSWTLVQNQYGAATSSVTATVVGEVPGACDPYVEAERLVMAEMGFPLHDATVIGWGVDWSLDKTRDVIVVAGRTQEPAGSFAPKGDDRKWQLFELHPESVARALARFEADSWQASAVFGLATCLDRLHPKAGALMEELVTERWEVRRMFTRLGRLTGGMGEQPPGLVVDPVVMSVDHGVIRERRQPRPGPRRVLAWERPTRRTPTRYG